MPDGSGAHLLLHVEKRGANSGWVAAALARTAQVASREVGLSGHKDRDAVTRQYYSLPESARAPAGGWTGFEGEGFRVLEATPHGRKLRTGTHRANRFRIAIRDVSGDPEAIAQRLARHRARRRAELFRSAALRPRRREPAGRARLGRGRIAATGTRGAKLRAVRGAEPALQRSPGPTRAGPQLGPAAAGRCGDAGWAPKLVSRDRRRRDPRGRAAGRSICTRAVRCMGAASYRSRVPQRRSSSRSRSRKPRSAGCSNPSGSNMNDAACASPSAR